MVAREHRRMDGSARVAGVKYGRKLVYFCGSEFWCWLFDSLWLGGKGCGEWHGLETYPRVGNERDRVARPRQAIKVAEFGFDRLEGEQERAVEVLATVA